MKSLKILVLTKSGKFSMLIKEICSPLTLEQINNKDIIDLGLMDSMKR